MSLKLNPISLCGMCIFFIFVDGTPVDVFNQASAIDDANPPMADRISEIPYEETNLGYISADAQQEIILDERNLSSAHEYITRDMDDETENFTGIPVLGISWAKPTRTKEEKYSKNNDFGIIFDDDVAEGGRLVTRVKTPRGKRAFNRDSAFILGTLFNPLQPGENIGQQIFLFKNNVDADSALLDNEEKKGQKTAFLFDSNLPDLPI